MIPLLLTERVRRVCRLAPDDVAFLTAHHAANFQLLPTDRRHVYALTPGAVVGVVQAPMRRLVIRAKIPLVNFFFLLDPLAAVPNLPDGSTPDDGRAALDFLAGQFVLRLRERVAAGLHHGYDERATTGPFLLGRLDVAAQMRDAAAHKEQLHCRHDAYTADVLWNRAVKAAATAALASPLVSDETRLALRAALPAFAEVQTMPLTPDLWAALDAAPASYRSLLDLGRLLAESLMPGETVGDRAGPAFLLNLEQVFERFLARRITHAVEADEGCTRDRVQSQPLIRASIPVAGQPDLQVRPDVLLFRDAAARLLVDAKWKRLGATPLIAADVYQVLAYCAALDVRRAVLIYPGRRDRLWHYDLERGDWHVVVYQLRVAGERAALERSAQRLTRFLLR